MCDRARYFSAIDQGNEQSRVEAERKRISDAQKLIQEQRDRLLAERQYLESLVERLKGQQKFCVLRVRMPFQAVNYNPGPNAPLLQHFQPIPSYLMPTLNQPFDGGMHATKETNEENIYGNKMDMDLSVPNTSVSMPVDNAVCTTESLETDIERLIHEMNGLMIMCSATEDDIDN